MRKALTIGVTAAVAIVMTGIAPAAETRPNPADVACRYFRTISHQVGAAGVDLLADVAAAGSDAYAYGVFEMDLRETFAAAGRDTTRSVRCGARAVTVRLLQYSLPIEPRPVTTRYSAFQTDDSDHLVSFRVNGARPAGRLLVASGQQASALGTTVALSSAYQVVRSGGEALAGGNELIVVLRATAPPDGLRDLATSVAEYRNTAGRTVPVHRVVAQGSPLQPGASAGYVVQFRAQPIGGDVTVPVLDAPASQAGEDAAVAPAVVPIR